MSGLHDDCVECGTPMTDSFFDGCLCPGCVQDRFGEERPYVYRLSAEFLTTDPKAWDWDVAHLLSEDIDATGSGSGWMRIHPAKLLHCTVTIDRLRRYDDDSDE